MDRDLRIRMLLQAGDKVSRPLRDIVSGSGKAAAALKATRDRLKEIEKAQADLGEFRALKSGLRTAGKELDDARARAARLAGELKRTEEPTKEMRDEFARAKKEAAALGTALDAQRQKLDLTRSRLTDAGVSTRHLVAAERALRDEVKHANAEISEQGRRIVQINDRMRRFHQARGSFRSTQDQAAKAAIGGGAAIGAGVAATSPLRSFATDAIKFESAMADVRKTVDGMNDPRVFKAMGDAVLDLSTRLPMVPDQIAAIVAAGGQIKIPRDQLLRFAEDATKMGVAFEVTGEEAGDMMSKWRAAFGLGRDGVVKLADQVNLLGNSGAKTLAVAEIVTRIGALGEVSGLNSGEVAGLAATLSAVGVESEVAATGIKNTMLALTAGASATKSQRAALKMLGLDAEKVSENMQRNGKATIVDVMSRIGALRKAQRAGVMTDLFGSESVAAISPMLTKLDKLQEFLRLAGDQSAYAGSMNKEFASRAATTANAIILAENNLTALKVTLGTDLLPMITDGAKAVGGMSRSFRAFSQENPAVASWLLKISAGFGAMMIAAGTVQFLGAGVKASLAPMQFAAKLMGTDLSTAALRFGKGLLYPIRLLPTLARVAAGSIMTIARLGIMFVASNPMLALAIGIGAAIFLIVRHWDTVKGVFNRGVAWISALVPRFRNFGSFLMQGLVNGIAAHFPNLTRILGAAAKIVASVFPKKTEIHSPSRLYHRYGGFLMSGLANGIQAGAAEPVRNLEAVTRRMTENMVVGSVLPGFGGGGGAPGAGGRTSASAAAPLVPVAPITIHIHGAPGQSEQQVAKLVGEEVRRAIAGNARSRSMSYAEPADYGDM